MSDIDKFRYAVLAAIHDEGLSVSDAIDRAYKLRVEPLRKRVRLEIGTIEMWQKSGSSSSGHGIAERLRKALR